MLDVGFSVFTIRVYWLSPSGPLIRCLLRDPALNPAIGGPIYEIQVFWELNFADQAGLRAFSPH
jgi:hypothetical protein